MICQIKISNEVLDFLTSNLKAEANTLNFHLNLRQLKRATKTCNLFFNTAAKRVEQRFYRPRIKPVVQQIRSLQVAARQVSTLFDYFYRKRAMLSDNVVGKLLKIAFQHILQQFCPFYCGFNYLLVRSKEGSISFRFLGGRAVGKARALTGKLLVTETFRGCS